MRRSGIIVAAMALIATLATARKAQTTDLTTASFLVATRDLQDPFFQHAVVLMVPSTDRHCSPASSSILRQAARS